MRDPKRLHEMPTIDRRTRLIIEAALADAPPRRRLRRIASGIASGAAMLGTKMAAAELAGAATAAPLVSALLITKWLSVGALGGLVVSLGLAELGELTTRDTQPTDTATAPLKALESQPMHVTGKSSVPDQPSAVTPEATPMPSRALRTERSASTTVRVPGAGTSALPNAVEQSAETATRTRVAAASFPAAAVAESSVLREEIAMIASAKAALDRNDPAKALAAAKAYRSRFLTGRLEPEASAIELEAHLRLGNRSDASELARRLATGRGPSAARARQVLEGAF